MFIGKYGTTELHNPYLGKVERGGIMLIEHPACDHERAWRLGKSERADGKKGNEGEDPDGLHK